MSNTLQAFFALHDGDWDIPAALKAEVARIEAGLTEAGVLHLWMQPPQLLLVSQHQGKRVGGIAFMWNIKEPRVRLITLLVRAASGSLELRVDQHVVKAATTLESIQAHLLTLVKE